MAGVLGSQVYCWETKQECFCSAYIPLFIQSPIYTVSWICLVHASAFLGRPPVVPAQHPSVSILTQPSPSLSHTSGPVWSSYRDSDSAADCLSSVAFWKLCTSIQGPLTFSSFMPINLYHVDEIATFCCQVKMKPSPFGSQLVWFLFAQTVFFWSRKHLQWHSQFRLCF